jgi:hypothetical protein
MLGLQWKKQEEKRELWDTVQREAKHVLKESQFHQLEEIMTQCPDPGAKPWLEPPVEKYSVIDDHWRMTKAGAGRAGGKSPPLPPLSGKLTMSSQQ